ncbi:unnamed protein product, partial [Prunus brigantina]
CIPISFLHQTWPWKNEGKKGRRWLGIERRSCQNKISQKKGGERKEKTWPNWIETIRVSWKMIASSGYKRGIFYPTRNNPHLDSKLHLSSLKLCNFEPHPSISPHFPFW